MKTLKIVAIAVLFALLFTACTKTDEVEKNYTIKEINGLKVYANKNVPSDENLKVELKEMFTIKGFEEDQPEERTISMPISLDADKEGNIFILDAQTKTIKKFSKTGEFIKSFCRQGTGPGEVRSAVAMNIVGDTVVVADDSGRKLVKFDFDGKHITDTSFGGARIPKTFSSMNDKHSIGYVWSEGMEDKDYMVTLSLSIIDNKFKEVKVLDSMTKKFIPGKFNIADMIGSFTHSNDKIFLSPPSADKLYINVYDPEGNELYRISKNYRKQMMTPKEMKLFNEGMQKAFGLGMDAVSVPKRAVNGLHFDKLGRIWSLTSTERDTLNQDVFYADLFKDGVYLNKIEVPQLTGADYFDIGRQLYFIGDYIYSLDMENNEIKVFDY
ncbi:MAG: 6-bladed beta-propeller [Candidatus Delongbacteria bacterium]|nr:6-bladed beta-propeller [Candidatus Delongbacteria bacterium]